MVGRRDGERDVVWENEGSGWESGGMGGSTLVSVQLMQRRRGEGRRRGGPTFL